MNIVITGATKGIGKAMANVFARHGANLAIAARNETDLQEVKRQLESAFPSTTVHTFAADLGNKEAVLAFAEFVKQHFTNLSTEPIYPKGRRHGVDALINNVGVFMPGDILDGKEGDLEQLINVNLYSAYHLTRALVPDMIKLKKGHVFNMCSIASLGPRANSGLYVISKYALLGMSKSLRVELQNKGIKVTAVLPGPTWSNAWEGSGMPQERLTPAEDVAQAVWNAYCLGPNAVIEELLIQPQLGDI